MTKRSPEGKLRRQLANCERKRRVYAARIAFARWVLGGKCLQCGSEQYLQFDHINPSTKSLELGRAAVVSLERFLAEIPKCQLLCHCCHVKKSKIDGTQPGGQRKIGEVVNMLDYEYDDDDDLIPAMV